MSKPLFNYRLTDMQAAIGDNSLKRLPALNERRAPWLRAIRKPMAGHEALVTPTEPAWAQSNWQSYVSGSGRAHRPRA
jgi:dTDP-4-amino-4,6-dideoxygalactose transaminase